MPASVIVAIVATVVVFGAQILLGLIAALLGNTQSVLTPIYTAAIAAPIVYGIVRGDRLAWQWGRLLAVLGASVAIMLSATYLIATANGTITPVAASAAPAMAGFLFCFTALPMLTIHCALGTPDSRAHFGLVCPSCGGMKVGAADFLFGRCRCRNCRHLWLPGDRPARG